MKTIRSILSIIISMTAISITCYKSGYEKGATEGVNAALDTVQNIVVNQIEKDTCLRLVLQTSDTNSYILSKSTIIVK